MNKLVTELALYDIMGDAGVGADISHCNTPVRVST
jgi:malate dehydrogenase